MHARTLTIITLPLALGLLSLATGCQSSPAGTTTNDADHVHATTQSPEAHAGTYGPEPIIGDAAVLLVYGMSCPLCATNVDNQLLALPGVERVHTNLDSGYVTVRFKEGDTARPSRRQLARAVRESGMTLMGITITSE